MGIPSMRISKMAAPVRLCGVLLAAISTTLLLGTTIAAPPVQARSVTYNLDIPAQSLNDALQALALASQHKLLYSSELVDGKQSPALKGQFTTEQAVKALLSGTHLNYEITSDGLVMIRAEAPPQGTNAVAPFPGGTGDPSIRLAHTDLGTTSVDNSATTQNQNVENTNLPDSSRQKEKFALTEIIVTAEKRSERLQDVPIPVSVISADTLAENNQPRLQDYYSSVPGLSVSPGGGAVGAQMLAIRGISSGFATNPTVGVTVDDVPFGSSTYGTGNLVSDFDPSDLARVEVLRGPQGTLYGAGSMGGLLKYVTVDPSTDGVYGRVQADVNGVYHGSGPGYGFRGAINVPLSDTLAVRASAFTRRDPGYIDNPMLGISGVNEDRVSGVRLSALWQPSQMFSFKISALYQDAKGNGLSDVDVGPGLGDLQQNYIRGLGGYAKQLQAYSATLKAKVGSVDLTSVSGYNISRFSSPFDFSYALGSLAQQLFGASGSPAFNNGGTNKFTQEIRAVVPIGQRLEWLVGGFYTHETSPLTQYFPVENPVTGAVVGSFGYDSIPSRYTEYATFTDLTVQITDRFDVQLGGREAHIEQTAEPVTEVGPLFGGSVVLPAINFTANAFTYLVTPQFKVSSDLMVYARIASGYRAGVFNSY